MYKANFTFVVVLFSSQIVYMRICVLTLPMRGLKTCSLAKRLLCDSRLWRLGSGTLLWSVCEVTVRRRPCCASLRSSSRANVPLSRCLLNCEESCWANQMKHRCQSPCLIDIPAWPLSVRSPSQWTRWRRTLSNRFKVIHVIAQTTLSPFSFHLPEAQCCVTLAQLPMQTCCDEP